MLKYGFFNSVSGDRKYDADDISNYFVKLISNGVFPNPSNNLQVVAKSGMTVTVKAGFGFINAKYANLTSDYDLTLDAADTTNPRIDRIVLRLNSANRQFSLTIIKGEAAAEPVAPDIVRTSTIYDLCLAQITVAANATAITTADIGDRRGYSSLCGYVTGLIQQIDTDDLFDQFEAAFNTWFENLQTNLTYNCRVQHLDYTTTLSAATSSVAFTIADYNPNIDILTVYVNGMICAENTDYSINTISRTIEFSEEIDAGATVQVEAIRSVGEVPLILYGDAPTTSL